MARVVSPVTHLCSSESAYPLAELDDFVGMIHLTSERIIWCALTPFVRKRLILVSSIGLLLIALGAAGLAWLFVKVGFAEPFFYVYMPGLVIFLLFDVGAFVIIQRAAVFAFVRVIFLRPDAEDSFERFRFMAAELFVLIARDLCWPDKLWSLVSRARKLLPIDQFAEKWVEMMKVRNLMAGDSSPSQLFVGSVFRAILAATLFLFIKSRTIYGVFLASIVLASLLSLHLSYILVPAGFVGKLRRTAGSPPLKFFTLAIIDLAAMTFALAALLRSLGWTVETQTLSLIAHRLLIAPKMIPSLAVSIASGASRGLVGETQLFKSTPLLNRLTFVFGFPMYVALLQTAFSSGWNSLKRNDEDYLDLAKHHMLDGATAKALTCLKKIKIRTQAVDEAFVRLYLLEGNIAKAKAVLARVFRVHREISDSPDNDELYFELISLWPFLSHSARTALLDHVRRDNLSQGARFICSLGIKSCQDNPALRHANDVGRPNSLYEMALNTVEAKEPAKGLEMLEAHEPTSPLDQWVYHFAEAFCLAANDDAELHPRLEACLLDFKAETEAILTRSSYAAGLFIIMGGLLQSEVAAYDPEFSDWFQTNLRFIQNDLAINNKFYSAFLRQNQGQLDAFLKPDTKPRFREEQQSVTTA